MTLFINRHYHQVFAADPTPRWPSISRRRSPQSRSKLLMDCSGVEFINHCNRFRWRSRSATSNEPSMMGEIVATCQRSADIFYQLATLGWI